MKYREMEIPSRMAKLPQYRGIPIPFTTLVDSEGVPHFKMTNENVWVAKRDGLCALCGEKLDYWIAFMVDENEAESRVVFDNPQHEECLIYAFNVCPWLYWSKARYSETWEKVDDFIGVATHPNREKSLDRPKTLGIYITNRYENIIKKGNGGMAYRVIKLGKAKRLEWIEGH
jgi:hypothetical protein